MSYIGAEPTTASFPFDQFSGNGSTTAFTLTYAPASATSIIVAISGVVQNPNLYSVIGTTITFSPAPPTGTNNISVLYLGLPVQIGTPTPGSRLELALGSAANPSLTFLGDTNTGIFSPGADRIGFAEGGSQVAEFDASGNFLFNSGYGSVATAYGCRAWVNFNGTGTVAIRASGNVSSITDGGVGIYTVNFTNAMPDANFAVSAITDSITGDASRPVAAFRTGSSTSTAVIQTVGTYNNNTNVDCSVVAVQIIR
jgi:hypothetical protein